jgi:hypothetical protein
LGRAELPPLAFWARYAQLALVHTSGGTERMAMQHRKVDDLSGWSTEALLAQAELLARRDNDGHLTIFRFTTEWKVMFGTPELDTGEGRDQVINLEGYPSLREALIALVSTWPIRTN